MSFDPIRILQQLSSGGVEFVLIGGMAGRVHGSPTVTNDLDICQQLRSPSLPPLPGRAFMLASDPVASQKALRHRLPSCCPFGATEVRENAQEKTDSSDASSIVRKRVQGRCRTPGCGVPAGVALLTRRSRNAAAILGRGIPVRVQ